MVYALSYRRPAHHPSSSYSSNTFNGSEKANSINESISSSSTTPSGVPEALSFDRIISGGTCPPVTIREFMDFLKYVEHSAENLQFFLWFKDYSERFENLPEHERKLSPEWTQAKEDAENAAYSSQLKQKTLSAEAINILKSQNLKPGTEETTPSSEKQDPFHDPRESPTRNEAMSFDSDHTKRPMSGMQSMNPSLRSGDSHTVKTTFEDAGVKLQPFTIQPFHEEITRILTIYIADGAPRQLNLSSRERTGLVHALQGTTHPSAFRSIVKTVEWSLRRQAHPNFIRWSICNGNRPRVMFARGLGIGGIVAGILTGLLITLSTAGRGWRVLALIPFMIGIATLIAAWKGMCVVLHGMHHRHLRPWELFGDEDRISEDDVKSSVETLKSGNSYEDEPWVPKYEKRNVIRKIFDREVWIEEPALRQIQDTIFIQAILGALLASAVLVGIFCAVPHGGYY